MTAPGKIDVLGMGCVAVDQMLFVDEYPAENSKVPVTHQFRQCGGLAANALAAVSRLGGRAAFAGALGVDADSDFVLQELRELGVDVTPCRRRPGIAPILSTIIVHERHQSRTILYDLSRAAPLLDADVHEELIRSAKVILVDHFGVEGMTKAARLARNHGIAVVGDLESDLVPGFDELLAIVDHLIVSEDFAMRRTNSTSPEQSVSRLWNQDREAVVVTCGPAGGWFRFRGEAAVRHYAAFPVTAVDTTGCGDVFHGAYALSLAEGQPIDERLPFAAAAAALKAKHSGGPRSIPDRAQLNALLLGEST